MLQAYFDESGTHDGAPVVSIAGLVGTEETWGAVSNQLAGALERFRDKGVRSFHMAEALAQEGQFARVDKPGINYLITQFAKRLGESEAEPLFTAVNVDAWDAVVRDSKFLEAFPTPFHLCFEDIVIGLAEWAARYAGGERVAPVFAYRQEYAESNFRGATPLQAYGSREWYRRRLAALGFDYADRVIPLQGADLLAHQIRADIESRIEGALDGGTKALHWAQGGRAAHGHWFDARALELTVERFRATGEIYDIRAYRRA